MAATDNEKKALARALEIIKSAQQAAEPKWTERQFYLNMYHSYDEKLKRKQWHQTKLIDHSSIIETRFLKLFSIDPN